MDFITIEGKNKLTNKTNCPNCKKRLKDVDEYHCYINSFVCDAWNKDGSYLGQFTKP